MFRSIASGVAKALPDVTRDIAGLAGVGLIAYGAWLVYPPAGYIVGGVLLIVGVLVTSFSGKARAG